MEAAWCFWAPPNLPQSTPLQRTRPRARPALAANPGWTVSIVHSTLIYMENNIHPTDEQRVSVIVYHLTWMPTRRRPVLTGNVARDCKALIAAACKEYGWQIHELDVQPDHVHLRVETFPTTSAAEVVKQCKAVTSRTLRNKYPVLRKLPSLWTRSYFAATVGRVSAETVGRYLEAQKGK